MEYLTNYILVFMSLLILCYSFKQIIKRFIRVLKYSLSVLLKVQNSFSDFRFNFEINKFTVRLYWERLNRNLNYFTEKYLLHAISFSVFWLLIALEISIKPYVQGNLYLLYLILLWFLYYSVLGAYKLQKMLYNMKPIYAFSVMGIILFFSMITWFRFFLFVFYISDLGVIFLIIGLFLFPSFIFLKTILNFVEISELRYLAVFLFDICTAVYTLMVLGSYNIVNDDVVSQFSQYSAMESIIKFIEYGANVVSGGFKENINNTNKSIQSLIWSLGVFIISHVVTPIASEEKLKLGSCGNKR
ncbi:hypothetical protein [Anaerospora sp.]|uniref:hypothetical protein n=1 Tax=Anaerospora sp. TaxID=1960278 RepID=UPI0028A0B46E|nr:hypothetical protein [Anaerospora sp.]